MRQALPFGFVLALAASTAFAQIPIPGFGSTFPGSFTRGFCFQAPVGFTITGLSVPNEGGLSYQVVEVLDFGATPPGTYPSTSSGTQLYFSNSTAAGSTIPCSIPIRPGSYIGILGGCTTTVGGAVVANSYAPSTGPFASNVLGATTTLARFGTQSSIAANGGNQPCFQEPGGTISRVVVQVAGSGISQPAFASSFSSTNSRGFCFQAPESFVIHGLRVPNETGLAYQALEVIDFGAAPPGIYPVTSSGAQLFYTNAATAGSIVPCAIPIRAGSYIGILGGCTATIGGVQIVASYSAQSSPFAGDVLGIPTPLTRFGTQSNLATTGGNQPCFQETSGPLGRVEVFAHPSLQQPAFGSIYAGAFTRGYLFQAPIDFRIEGLRVPDESNQPYQVVEVIDYGSSPPPLYPATAAGTQRFFRNDAAAGSIVPCSIPVAAGTWLGVLGGCTPTVGSTTLYASYSITSGNVATSLLGAPVTLSRLGTQSSISSNGGNQPCFQETSGSIGRVEMLVAPRTHEAMWQSYGTGCVSRATAAFYEYFGANQFDLSNHAIRLAPNGHGYDATAIPYAWWSPVGTNLGLGDDTVSAALPLGFTLNYPGGSTGSVYASSNGFVWAQSGGGSDCCNGSPAAFVSGAARWSLLWNDLNPVGGGTVVFDQDVAHGAAYLTFSGVPEYGTTNANTFQIAFFATGVVEYRWQACTVQYHTPLVGWSPGAVADPGSVDFSQALPIHTQPDLTPLALGANARPVLGQTIQLQTTNLPVTCLFGVTLLGLTEYFPGIDLTASGMAGCYQYVSGDASLLWFPSGGSASSPFHVPAVTAFEGLPVRSQSLALVPGANLLGVAASNGVRLVLDIY